MNDPEFDPYRPPQASLGSDRDDEGSGETEIPEGSPFATIWTRPRGTIRGVVEADPNQHFWFLGILFGIHRTFDQAIGFQVGDKYPLLPIVAACVIVGIVVGPLFLTIYAALIRMTGGWIGGTASDTEARAALSWASLPQITVLVVLVPAIGLVGQDLFRGFDPQLGVNQRQFYPIIIIGLFQCVMLIWGFVILLKCVGEVQGFSAWKGLLNVFMAGLFLIPIACVVGFVGAFVFVLIFGPMQR